MMDLQVVTEFTIGRISRSRFGESYVSVVGSPRQGSTSGDRVITVLASPASSEGARGGLVCHEAENNADG